MYFSGFGHCLGKVHRSATYMMCVYGHFNEETLYTIGERSHLLVTYNIFGKVQITVPAFRYYVGSVAMIFIYLFIYPLSICLRYADNAE